MRAVSTSETPLVLPKFHVSVEAGYESTSVVIGSENSRERNAEIKSLGTYHVL
jgi:hypothetical protein